MENKTRKGLNLAINIGSIALLIKTLLFTRGKK